MLQKQEDTGRHRKTPEDTGRHRKTQEDTGRHRKTQEDTGGHRRTQEGGQQYRSNSVPTSKQNRSNIFRVSQKYFGNIVAIS